jgi:uncharacterized membrane protein
MQNRLNKLMTVALVLMAGAMVYQSVRIGNLEVELTNFQAGVKAWAGADAETDHAQDRFNREVMAQLEVAR